MEKQLKLTIKDQLNNVLVFKTHPKRIISLVPSQTELLVALGLEDQIVGITKFCIHPTHLKKQKAIIGGTKKVHYQKIRDLHPDIIVCNKEENTKEMVIALQKIAPVYVSDIYTITDVVQLFLNIGTIFNKVSLARKLGSELQDKVVDFKEFIKDKPQKKVAYFIWANPWMVAGRDNFINELLKLNNYDNVFEATSRYPEIELKQLSIIKPDIILLSSEPYPFKEKHSSLLQQYSNAEILFVDGEFFSWYGSRLLQSFDYFKSLHA